MQKNKEIDNFLLVIQRLLSVTTNLVDWYLWVYYEYILAYGGTRFFLKLDNKYRLLSQNLNI